MTIKNRLLVSFLLFFTQIVFSQNNFDFTEKKLDEITEATKTIFLNFDDKDYELEYSFHDAKLYIKITNKKKRIHKKMVSKILSIVKNHPDYYYTSKKEYTDGSIHEFRYYLGSDLNITEVFETKPFEGTIELTFYTSYNGKLNNLIKNVDISKTKNGKKLYNFNDGGIFLAYAFTSMIEAFSENINKHNNKKDTLTFYNGYTNELLFDLKAIKKDVNKYETKLSPKVAREISNFLRLQNYDEEYYFAPLYIPYRLVRCAGDFEQDNKKCLLAKNRFSKKFDAELMLYQKENTEDVYMSIGHSGFSQAYDYSTFEEKKARKKNNELSAITKQLEAENYIILEKGKFPKNKSIATLNIKSKNYLIYILAISKAKDCNFVAESSTYNEWETGNSFLNIDGELMKEMQTETITSGGNFKMIPKDKIPLKLSSFNSIGLIGLDISSDKRHIYSSYYKDVEFFHTNCNEEVYYFVFTF